jgi:hypothetical protein
MKWPKINFLKMITRGDTVAEEVAIATGHPVTTPLNVSLSDEVKTILTKAGVTPTVTGAVSFLEKTVDAGIEADGKLTDAEKLVFVSFINSVIDAAAAKATG